MAWEDVEVDLDALAADPSDGDDRWFEDDDVSDEDVDWEARLGERDAAHPFGRVSGAIQVQDRDDDDLLELRLTPAARDVVTGREAREARLAEAQRRREQNLTRTAGAHGPTAVLGTQGRHRVVPTPKTGGWSRQPVPSPRLSSRHEWVPGGVVVASHDSDSTSTWRRTVGVIVLVLICIGIVTGAIVYGARLYEQTTPVTPPSTGQAH